MTTINSVLGPLDTAELGFTLMHEHITGGPPGAARDYPELFGAGFMERIIGGLTQAKSGGIDTIVDATTHDLGRDITRMAEASRRSGINVIASTGWWLEISNDLTGVSADQFARLFIRDIEKGIAGTEIKAGILKAASDAPGVTPMQEIILRGVARAHHQTKVPITLHSYPVGHVGTRQLAILKEEGVDLKRVIVGHSNETTDIEYLISLLEQGCYIGMDRFPGHSAGVSTLGRTKTVKAVIDAGYANRLILSHDWILAQVVADTPVPFWQELREANPHGLLFIKKVVVPQLREMGVPEATLNSIFVDNPRNFFEGN